MPVRLGRRITAAFEALASWAVWVRVAMPKPLQWLTANPKRLLMLAWLVGVMMAGHAGMASADPIIVGPDLAHGSQKTLFESYDFTTYQLTVKPDANTTSGWFNIDGTVLQVIGWVNDLLLWAGLGILYGALTLLEWFLNLTLYRDSAGQIDTATQMIANHVFWPLIGATVAIGAFMAYAKWRADGRGFVSDLGWVVAAGVITVVFAAGPSQIMSTIDGARQDMASGIIAGSTDFVNNAGNVTGFPTPAIGGDPQQAATRKLVDGIWNTFGATPWCYAEFHDLSICKQAGFHALANDPQWRVWSFILDNQGSVPQFGTEQNWIRGQDPARTGVVLLLFLISVPMGLMLLWLIVSGLLAVVGFLLMLVIGLLFLVLWPIPGWCRQVGTRYWMYTIGLELQGLFITVVISADMVVVTIISTGVGKYGFFVVALLNLASVFAALKARAWLEMLTTVGGAGTMGVAGAMMARAAAGSVMRLAAGALSGGVGLAAGAARAFMPGRGGGGQSMQAARNWASLRDWSGKSSGSGRMSGLDNGPLRATAARQAQPTGAPGLPGRGAAALPGGAGSANLPATVSANGAAAAAAARGTARSAPMAAQGTHRAGAAGARPTIVDGTVARNVAKQQARSGQSGRVWVATGGSGLSSLDKTPPPRPASQRGGAYRITSARGPLGGKS